MDLRPSVAAFVRETGVTAWMTSALLHACNLIRRKKMGSKPLYSRLMFNFSQMYSERKNAATFFS